MQTKQRKIPMRGVDKTFITWKEMLPVYTKELNHFKKSIDSLKSIKPGPVVKVIPFSNADVKILAADGQTYQLLKSATAFTDTTAQITAITEQLAGLKGIKFSKSTQIINGTTIQFSTTSPVKLLIGFFNEKNPNYLPPPQLETDASANNYGQAEIKISNALVLMVFRRLMCMLIHLKQVRIP
jgi:hypothetical protein